MNIFNANRLKRPSLSRQLFGDLASIGDGLLIIASGAAAHVVYFNLFHTSGDWTLTGAVLGSGLTVLVMRNTGIFKLGALLDWSRNLGKALSTWAVAFLGLIAIAFLVKTTGTYSRGWAITWLFTDRAKRWAGRKTSH
ncbi:MAG: hypothetical protein JKX82_05010 [Oleispira sp.]|nr:hypothetical protein [Oleispira sp.]